MMYARTLKPQISMLHHKTYDAIKRASKSSFPLRNVSLANTYNYILVFISTLRVHARYILLRPLKNPFLSSYNRSDPYPSLPFLFVRSPSSLSHSLSLITVLPRLKEETHGNSCIRAYKNYEICAPTTKPTRHCARVCVSAFCLIICSA